MARSGMTVEEYEELKKNGKAYEKRFRATRCMLGKFGIGLIMLIDPGPPDKYANSRRVPMDQYLDNKQGRTVDGQNRAERRGNRDLGHVKEESWIVPENAPGMLASETNGESNRAERRENSVTTPTPRNSQRSRTGKITRNG